MKKFILTVLLTLTAATAVACPVKGTHIHGGTGSHHSGGTCY